MNKKQAMDYLKKTEVDIQSANAALFFTDLAYSSYADSYKVHEIDYGPVFCRISCEDLHLFFQFLSKKNINAVAKKMYTLFIKDPNSLKSTIEKHKELTKKIDGIWEEYIEEKDLLKTYKKLIKTSREWWYYGSIGEDKGQIIDSEVVPNFEKGHALSKAEAREVVYGLSHPEEQTVLNIERKIFLNICNEILDSAELTKSLKSKDYDSVLKNKKILEKIKTYIKEFFWIKTTFYSSKKITPLVLIKDIEKEIKKHSKKKISEEIRNIEKNFLDIVDEKQKILNRIELTKDDKKDIEFAKLTIYWIDQRKLGMMKQFYYFTQLFEDIAKKFNLDYHELAVSRANEIEQFLESGKRLGKGIIKKRDKGVMSIYEKDNKITEYYGKDAEDLFKFASRIENREIKGIVASRTDMDKIRGIAKIIKNPEKYDIEKGEILVTSMTRIEFVPMMRKAKAIITDEGGIACHAAIVSRELKIPCIIGTKTATKLLKTGDKIVLDLEKGTVIKE